MLIAVKSSGILTCTIFLSKDQRKFSDKCLSPEISGLKNKGIVKCDLNLGLPHVRACTPEHCLLDTEAGEGPGGRRHL